MIIAKFRRSITVHNDDEILFSLTKGSNMNIYLAMQLTIDPTTNVVERLLVDYASESNQAEELHPRFGKLIT